MFKNANGLPEPEHKVTSRELAQLTRYLIEVFPKEYRLYSQPDFTWNNIRQQNRNPLLGTYPGADGVKTGYTKESGYGMVGSARRDGRRLIVVVNGLRTAQERATEARKLLDFGFRQFHSYELFGANETVGDARVWGGTSSWVRLVAREPVRVLLSEQEKPNARTEIVYRGPLIAPVSEGQEVGFVRLTIDGKAVSRVPLITGGTVPQSPDMWRKALDRVMFAAFGG